MIDSERIELQKRRDIGEIIDASLKLYTRNFGAYVSLAALVIPLGIASGIFQTISNDLAAELLVAVIALCQVGVNLLSGAAIIVALADVQAGRPPDVGRAFDVAFSRFITLILGVLRAAFHVVLFALTIVGIPWAIQRSVRWLFVQQAIMLEGATPKEALSSSAAMVAGSWWRTLGCWILISLLGAIPVVVASVGLSFAPIVVSSTGSAVIDALVLPFVAIGMTLLYFDLKVRKEQAMLASPQEIPT